MIESSAYLQTPYSRMLMMSTEKQLAVTLFWGCPSLMDAVIGFADRCRPEWTGSIDQRTALKQNIKESFAAACRQKIVRTS